MRSSFSQSLFLIYFGAIMLTLSSCLQEGISPAVKSTLEAVAQEYAPDSRVAVFKIKPHLENDSLILSGETSLPEAKEILLQRLQERDIVYVDQITVLPAPALNGYEYGVVNVSVANIRSNPKHSAELATQALLGTGLRVYKSEGEWYYIQSPDGYLGWMDSGSFKLMDQAAYQQWLDAAKVIFTADYGLVLDAPKPNAGRLGDLVSGDILLSTDPQPGYHGVIYPDGRRGYIADADGMLLSDWLHEKTAVSPAAFINAAMNFMGRPYLWGGTSGKGMDCSGFTKTVYFMNGFVIPRDASQQVNAGIDIPTDSTLNGLTAGDFLFFGQKAQADQPERIRHVGIYLGQGQFIHSGADNPGIRIESLWPDSPNFAEHRLESFIRARRMEAGSPGIIPISELTDFYGMRPAVSSIQD